MILQAYPSYRTADESDIHVPTHWGDTSVKRVARIVNGTTPKSGNPEYWDGGIVWVTPADLSKISDRFIRNSAKRITHAGLSSCGTQLVPQGTVVLSSRAPIGSVGVAGIELCTNQGCKSLVPSSTIDSTFLYYLLSCSTAELNQLGRGTTFLELSSDALGSFGLALPPIEEQTAIANFLDCETAKIDTLIDKQEQLIILLEEKRQAVISHAVTKGLNPDVPMKDSGVEWLGEVPEHWEVRKLKFLSREVTAGPFGSSLTKDKYVAGGYRVYGQEQVIANNFEIGDYYIPDEVYQELRRHTVKVGDVLVSCVGTFGKIAVVPRSAEKGIINPRLVKVTPSDYLSPSFMREALTSPYSFRQFETLSRGGTMGVINAGILKEIVLAVPPIQEQMAILEEISSANMRFGNAIEVSREMVALSKERRTALISAAVTGKIDVRNAV